jgi:hypothetical protein
MVINIKIGDFYKDISWTAKYKKIENQILVF